MLLRGLATCFTPLEASLRIVATTPKDYIDTLFDEGGVFSLFASTISMNRIEWTDGYAVHSTSPLAVGSMRQLLTPVIVVVSMKRQVVLAPLTCGTD